MSSCSLHQVYTGENLDKGTDFASSFKEGTAELQNAGGVEMTDAFVLRL